jgi:tripartite ATP-independent transporter DctP family solute receptor
MQFMKTVTMAATAGILALGMGQAQARQFRAADVQPPDYPTVKALNFMSDELGKITNGKDTIKVFPSGQLGSEKDTTEQIELGAIDMLRINTGSLNTICPTLTVAVLPYVFKSVDQMHRVLDGPIGDQLLASCQSAGMVGLAFYDSGARSFYTKKPVASLADLKGMKLRVQQSDVWVDMIKLLGANPTPLDYGEVFTGLKTGLIDGAENNWPSLQTAHHYEVVSTYLLDEHSMAPEILVMSKKAFDGLSADEQAAVRKAAKDSVPYMRQQWSALEDQSKAIVEKAGVKVVTVDKAPFQAAMQPLYAKYLTTPEMKDIYAKIQQVN